MRYSDELPVDVEPYASSLASDRREDRDASANFLILALHQIFLRIGWIFKTESVVIPVFMDFIGGGSVLRGWLMVINRIGFSVPPVLFSRRLKIAPRKKWLFAACSLGMAVPFACLSLIWFSGVWQAPGGSARWWMPAVFLILYAIFFAVTGMNQLAAHALQGKVIRETRRGRLFMTSIVLGSPLAIAAAWFWMPGWLAEPTWGFGAIFAVPAVAFALAGVAVMALREEPDDFQQEKSRVWEYFHHSWEVVRDDADCRRLAVMAILFSATFMLFPHYVAAIKAGASEQGTEASPEASFDLSTLALWVCVQNASTALFSLVAGPLADRQGNRAALHLTMTGAALAPLFGLVALLASPDLRMEYAWLLFVPIGFTPITLRLLVNYALEIAPRHDHPKYVSVLGLSLALPVIVGAPLVGLAIDVVGFAPVFAAGLLSLAAAIWLSFRIAEPRRGESANLPAFKADSPDSRD